MDGVSFYDINIDDEPKKVPALIKRPSSLYSAYFSLRQAIFYSQLLSLHLISKWLGHPAMGPHGIHSFLQVHVVIYSYLQYY